MIASIINGTIAYGVDYSKRGCVTINIDTQEKKDDVLNATDYKVVFDTIDIQQLENSEITEVFSEEENDLQSQEKSDLSETQETDIISDKEIVD